jgi:hypothetical protein
VAGTSQSWVEAGNNREDSHGAFRPWLGGVLVLSVALQLIGAFFRYATVATRLPPGQADLAGLPSSISFTFFNGLTMGGRPAFLATLGIVAVIGCGFVVRPTRGRAGFIVGLCGPSVGAAAYLLVEWTRRSATYSFGPGYFILLIGVLVEATVAASLFVALRSSGAHPERRASRSVLALCTAVAVGTSTMFLAVRFMHYEPLGRFTPLTLASAVAACIAFTATAALPVLAYRVSGRTGVAIASGVAVGMTVQVLDAVLRRTEFGRQMTVGWWIDVAATVLSVVLARRLARDAKVPVEAIVVPAP